MAEVRAEEERTLAFASVLDSEVKEMDGLSSVRPLERDIVPFVN